MVQPKVQCDPLMNLDEDAVREALRSLNQKNWQDQPTTWRAREEV